MCEFKTKSVILLGKKSIELAVARLIENSQWFAVTPLPDDEWELHVKEENFNYCLSLSLT